VVWTEFYGTANTCQIDIKDNIKTSTVTINSEGGINY